MKEPRGLGKGLEALLGSAATADSLRKPVGYVNKEIAGTSSTATTSSDVLRVPVELIEPNPYQPRLTFDQDALNELADSIRTLGLIQPITVRKISDRKYQIISGERRFRACTMAGMTLIPAYVRDANEQGMLEMAIVENIQREDLDPVETALSYQRLIDECSLTQEQMAERVGKKRATITNSLRLLLLPAKVQHDLKVGLLSTGHAKAILGIDDPLKQEEICNLAVSEGLSVREVENLVRKMKDNPSSSVQPRKKEPEQLPENYVRMLSNLGNYFSSDISVKRGTSGKGTITIKFQSDDEVNGFLAALESRKG